MNTGSNGIREGFQALAQIFAPNAGGMIEADLARGKRALMEAQSGQANAVAGDYRARAGSGMYDQQANLYGAQAGQANAVADTTRNADGREQQTHDNLMGLAGALTGIDPATPEGRKALIGALGSAGIDLNDPGTVAGYSTLINPQFETPDNMAQVFLGTGVVDNYGQTQPGQAQAEADAQTRQGMVNDQSMANSELASITELEKQRISDEAAGGRQTSVNETELLKQQFLKENPNAGRKAAPPIVSAGVVKALTGTIGDRLAAEFKGAEVPPELLQSLVTEAAAEFQRTRNAASAVENVLAAAGLQSNQFENRIWPGPSQRVERGLPGGGLLPQPGAAPQAATGGTGAAAEPTATDANGNKVAWRNGQWVPM